ncbi:MAG TPA: GAF domain-containing protein, partial [Gaiellaceae bacterium]|nr:GAF domain-containing protein [Gaiellaceae bacterium]
MTTETQAVLFNALPLLLLAALYLAAGAALAPAFWRERRRLRELGYASALLFPCIGVAAAVVGLQSLVSREPLAGHVWLSLPAIAVAALPILALLANWGDRELLVTGVQRARQAEQLTSLRDRELRAVERLSRELGRASQPDEIGRVLADEATELFDVDLAQLALVGEDGRTARVVAARERGQDVDWLVGQQLDLEREPTAIATLLSQPAPFAVFDAQASAAISQRLTEQAGVRSVGFVPVFGDERVVGVLVVATRQPRVFGDEELALMQAFASEAGMALARAASAVALGEALERERLVARISLEVRSRLDLEETLRVACEEAARAIGCSRCFVRLTHDAEPTGAVVEWVADGVEPLGPDPLRLPAVSLAAREGRTVAFGDVLAAPELRDPTLGDVDALVARGEAHRREPQRVGPERLDS